MNKEEVDNESIDTMKDEIYVKLEHQRVATGLVRCFPLYICVCPNGYRRKKISFCTIVLVYLMMLIMLIGVNLYCLFSILPDVINNDVFRVSNDNLSKLVDRVSTLKEYDMEVMINDILTFDSLLGDVSQGTIKQSNYDPNSTNPQLLQRSYDNAQSNGSVNNTAYFIRPQTTALADETQYYQFSESIPWCKLLSTFFHNYFEYSLQDMIKVSTYLGFGNSEVFCQYPHLTSSFFYSENDAENNLCSGYSYNLATGKCFYNARIRSWYLNAKTDFGYSYLNSLYIFSSSGKYGNTLSMTIRQANEQILAVMGFDFQPLGENSYIQYNLISGTGDSEAEFDYFLLDPALLNSSFVRTEDFTFGEADWSNDQIAQLLIDLIYTTDTEKSSIKKLTINNIQKETIYYAEFTGGGKQRYMFFNPWYLNMRARDDRTKKVVGDIFVLIINKDFFAAKREHIQNKIEEFVYLICSVAILFIFTFGFMISNWVANRYSGTIVKQIVDSSKSILEFNYSLLRQRLGSQDKLKNIINKREVNEEVVSTKNELDSMMKIVGQFVRMFRIHFIDLSKIDDKQLLNQILMEYYMAKKRAGYSNRCINVGACYNNIGYLAFYMNSFELAKESFAEAIKSSNPVTAVSRSFNKSIAAYCLAASIDGTQEGEEYEQLNPRRKQNQKKIKKRDLLYEEASECFEECIVRMNSSSITPTNDQDIDYKVLQFLCKFFKICCQLKKTKIRSLKRKWNEEVKQLEESQEIKNKDVDKISKQLTGFSRFLKLKAELLQKLKKALANQLKEKKFIPPKDSLGLSKLEESERKELIDCLNNCFVKSECINTFILSREVLKSFLDFLRTVYDMQNPQNQIPQDDGTSSNGSESFQGYGKLVQKKTLNFMGLKKKLKETEFNHIVPLLVDYKRLTDPKTRRIFFLFIDSNLRDSRLAQHCTGEFIKVLKDTDRLSIIRVRDRNKIETILSLTECKWAKKNIDYVMSMVENPVDYSSKNANVLESIISYFNHPRKKEMPFQQARGLNEERGNKFEMFKKESTTVLATSDNTESWIIGLHSDKVSPIDREELSFQYKELFKKHRMYTIILGTKVNKDLENLLEEEEDPTQYYYQYGTLHLENLKFISGLLKMQKYKDTHFLFTERICE